MVKKTIEDAILIKRLLDKKMLAWQISKKYGIRKQKISYWKHHEILYVNKSRWMLLKYINPHHRSIVNLYVKNQR